MLVEFLLKLLYIFTFLCLCCCHISQRHNYSVGRLTFDDNSTNCKGTDKAYELPIVYNEVNITRYDDKKYLRVIHGRTAVLGEVPYQVALMQQYVESEYVTVCGGAIVTHDKVVSAAHCVVDFMDDTDKINIVAGQLSRVAFYGMQGQWRRPKLVVYHEHYKFPNNDISIIKLNTPFQFNTAVKALPHATEFKDYQLTCVVSGYGHMSKDYKDESTLAPELQVADLQIISLDDCDDIHKANMERFICTDDNVSDVSKGDSGGPLVCHGTGDPAESEMGILVGIVCGAHKIIPKRTMFTRVSVYKDFIESSKLPSLKYTIQPKLLFFCTVLLFLST